MELYTVLSVVILAVVLVNGWTDAPNAIATAVATRSLGVNRAVFMAAACNLLGVFGMTIVSANVANTVSSMLDFTCGDAEKSAAALLAGMCSVILFSCAAWVFGIPTSESHGLIAGITGAALYLNGLSAVNLPQWGKVITGLIISLTLGFLLGYFFTVLCRFLGYFLSRNTAARLFGRGEVACAAAMAVVHGAQDGQKFIGVFLIASMLKNGVSAGETVNIRGHLDVVVLCALVMAAGTMIGGKRIIKSVGFDITPLKQYEGFCADLASVCSLFVSTILGLPVSTTHVKTMAVVAVGFSDKAKHVEIRTVKQMVCAWAVTFPVCTSLGYLLTGLVLRFFF